VGQTPLPMTSADSGRDSLSRAMEQLASTPPWAVTTYNSTLGRSASMTSLDDLHISEHRRIATL
jgi:hypothetical protein